MEGLCEKWYTISEWTVFPDLIGIDTFGKYCQFKRYEYDIFWRQPLSNSQRFGF